MSISTEMKTGEDRLAQLRTLPPAELIEECDHLLYELNFAGSDRAAGLVTMFREMLDLLYTDRGRSSIAYEHHLKNRFLEVSNARTHVDAISGIVLSRLASSEKDHQ